MRPKTTHHACTVPELLTKSSILSSYLKTLSKDQISRSMKVSETLTEDVHEIIHEWGANQKIPSAAVDTFLGDIYSGLQAAKWTEAQRNFAQNNLRILSGLYGILKPMDAIAPYRLEMGYRLPDDPYKNLYTYWSDTIAKALPDSETILNLAANEYSKVVIPYLDPGKIITPQFLTISPKTNEPTFVVVHAKIARGAFANWIITNKILNRSLLKNFSDIGYTYDKTMSTENAPVYICQTFAGKGLSVRLS